MADDTGRGHKTLAHTADVVIEAWGANLSECVNEAVAGAVATFAAPRPNARRIEFDATFAYTSAQDTLMSVLEDLIFSIDARDLIIQDVDLQLIAGTVHCRYGAVGVEQATQTGPPPKAIAFHEFDVVCAPGKCRAHFIIDI